MPYFKTVLLASAIWILGATAQSASVVNDCSFDIYVLSTPTSGASTPIATIAPGANYSETYTSGSAVKISNSSTVANPLTFEYTPNPAGGLVYYDLSNNAGNPFSAFENTLVPSNTSCFAFVCQGGTAGASCYSNGGNIQVKACYPTDLTTTVCAGAAS